MLTREQKIDFLKCCIAAYEDERVAKRVLKGLGLFPVGFCEMFDSWDVFIHPCPSDFLGSLAFEFPKFFDFSEKRRTNPKPALYHHPCNLEGMATRAQIAREFLKTEYGITVPKRKKK